MLVHSTDNIRLWCNKKFDGEHGKRLICSKQTLIGTGHFLTFLPSKQKENNKYLMNSLTYGTETNQKTMQGESSVNFALSQQVQGFRRGKGRTVRIWGPSILG